MNSPSKKTRSVLRIMWFSGSHNLDFHQHQCKRRCLTLINHCITLIIFQIDCFTEYLLFGYFLHNSRCKFLKFFKTQSSTKVEGEQENVTSTIYDWSNNANTFYRNSSRCVSSRRVSRVGGRGVWNALCIKINYSKVTRAESREGSYVLTRSSRAT